MSRTSGPLFFHGGDPGFEFIEAVPHQLELSFCVEPALGRISQPRGGFGARRNGGQRDEARRPVRAVGQPGGDVAGAIPASKHRPGSAGASSGHVEGDPIRPVDLGLEFEVRVPLVDPVIPVHHVPPPTISRRQRPIIISVLTALYRLPHAQTMFERFTARARHAIVLAQDESRRLQHNYIGTEHLLLGLLAEGDGVGGRALAAAGVSLDETRKRVEQVVGRGKRTPSGHIPFTPRAKKVLELGLREALNLGHDYIGTEHLLLGIMSEGEGLGTKLLVQQHVDLAALRTQVVAMVPATTGSRRRRFWAQRPRSLTPPTALDDDDPRTTAAATASLDEAQRLAGEAAVGSHHLLLATLSDPTSAAAKALGSLGIDLDQARTALRNVDVAGTTDELPEEAGRRQLTMRLTDATLTLETTDPTLVAHARRALAGPEFTLRGDDDRSRGFADLWSAWDASLRATAATIVEVTDEQPPVD